MRMAFDIDVRQVAPAINVPTLIVHATGDKVCHVENGRFLSKTIPRARYVELPGDDHVLWFAPDDTLAEIPEFLTGQRETATPDRVLATVLFTDLAGSTAGGATCSNSTTRPCVASSGASAGTKSTPQATASSPPSTARRVLFVARDRSWRPSAPSASRFVRACTRARSSYWTGRSPGSR
jgi:hypothetical protein